jgi:hypothetical protein
VTDLLVEGRRQRAVVVDLVAGKPLTLRLGR